VLAGELFFLAAPNNWPDLSRDVLVAADVSSSCEQRAPPKGAITQVRSSEESPCGVRPPSGGDEDAALGGDGGGEAAAVGEEFAGVVEADDAVAEQDPALVGVVGDDAGGVVVDGVGGRAGAGVGAHGVSSNPCPRPGLGCSGVGAVVSAGCSGRRQR